MNESISSTTTTTRAALGSAIRAALKGMVSALITFLMFAGLVIIQALRVFFTLAPGLLRLAVIGAALAGAATSWPKVYLAYGGDVAAALPAFCVVLAPVAFALSVGGQVSVWGALLLAGGVTYGAGVVIPSLPAAVRGLAVVGVIVAIIFYFLTKTEVSNEPKIR